MQIYKLALRRSIIALLIDRLSATLDLDFPDGTRAVDGISMYEIDAVLSFMSDRKLDELRDALTRLDVGTFGKCVRCKSRIDWSLLLRDPVRRFCPDCDVMTRNPGMMFTHLSAGVGTHDPDRCYDGQGV